MSDSSGAHKVSRTETFGPGEMAILQKEVVKVIEEKEPKLSIIREDERE